MPTEYERRGPEVTHTHGTPKIDVKHLENYINRALHALLWRGTNVEVTVDQIRNCILEFCDVDVTRKKVDEHCQYKAELDTPTLRIVRDGVFALANGCDSYYYKTISHRHK